MGRGNWFPGSSLEECEVAYVEVRSLEEDADEDMDAFAWQDFKEFLTECLGGSFDCRPTHREASDRFDGLGRDDVCFGFNGLFGVFVDGQGDNFHLGVGVLVRSDAPAFGKARLYGFAKKLFDKIQERYDVSVRTSAWTSAPRKKTEAPV
jgi:hypothetical protein